MVKTYQDTKSITYQFTLRLSPFIISFSSSKPSCKQSYNCYQIIHKCYYTVFNRAFKNNKTNNSVLYSKNHFLMFTK